MAIPTGIGIKEITNSKTINNRDKDLQRSRSLRLRRQIIKAFTAIKVKIKVFLARLLFNQDRAIQMIKEDAGVQFGFQTDRYPGNGFHLQDRPEAQNQMQSCNHFRTFRK